MRISSKNRSAVLLKARTKAKPLAVNVILQDYIGSASAGYLREVALPGLPSGASLARKSSNSRSSRSCAA